EGYDIPSTEIDGTDIFKVYTIAGEAIARARAGGGPSLLHIRVPRYYGHYSGDPDTYRTPEEKKIMRQDQDCLVKFRTKVTAESLADVAALDAIDAEVEGAVNEAVVFARASDFPPASALTTDVYVKYL
ncbi:thiamine pyrophosphate-dependent enzyme, partial [Pseudomonas putida]